MKQAVKNLLRQTGLRREQVATARMWGERNLITRLPSQRRPPREGGRILCYHSVGQPRTGVNDVSPSRFRQQIETALACGYRFTTASHIGRTGGSADELAITFDDAWTSVAEYAAPILSDYGLPWTLFVVSGWSDHDDDWTREAILGWSALERLMARDRRLEIGSHSVTHTDFSRLDPHAAQTELQASRLRIGERLGVAPTTFAIPYGLARCWSPTATLAAQATGYEVIYAQAEAARSPGTVGRSFVSKFDTPKIFKALLGGAFDQWEEWA